MTIINLIQLVNYLNTGLRIGLETCKSFVLGSKLYCTILKSLNQHKNKY